MPDSSTNGLDTHAAQAAFFSSFLGPSGERIRPSAGSAAYLQQALDMGFKPHHEHGDDADANLRADMADLMNMGYSAKSAAQIVHQNQDALGAHGRTLEDWTNHTNLNQLQQQQEQGQIIQANGGRGFQGADHDGNLFDKITSGIGTALNIGKSVVGMGII